MAAQQSAMATNITEVAQIEIKPGEQAAFEAVFPQAEQVISQAEGYVSHTIQRCLETDNRYLLLVQWTSVEAHTVGFRHSELFKQWRTIIGPFFEKPPYEEHYSII